MKPIAFFIFLLVGVCNCFSQVDSTKIPFASYWSKGDSYDFKITKISQRWNENELTINDTTSYIVNFDVIDSTETSYKIKWSYLTNLSDFIIPDHLKDKFFKYKTTNVVYKTNEVGSFIEVENWEEISTMLKQMFNDYVEILKAESNVDKKSLDKIIQPMLNALSTKEGVELYILKEIQLFHFPFGADYSIKEPLVYDHKYPNIYGCDSLKAKTKVYVERVNYDSSFCVLVQEMKLDSKDARRVMAQIFAKIEVGNKEMERAIQGSKFEVMDFNRFEYYYKPGVPSKIETVRTSLMNVMGVKTKSVEKSIIELIQ